LPGCLHQAAPLREVLQDRLHPGGPELTQRALALAGAGHDQLILDAGCGPGGSLKRLRAWGYGRALGLDCDKVGLAKAGRKGLGGLVAGDLARLPLSDNSLDVVLCECAWNLSHRTAALHEFWRTLRPGGSLIISDMYQRASSAGLHKWPLECCFAGATGEKQTREMVSSAGFRLVHFEDHSVALRQLAAELVLAHGSLEAFWQVVTGDASLAQKACLAGRRSLPGLFLLIAKKA
jgi:arsenite methyltransferase